MLDVMYDIPSQDGVEHVKITEEAILKKASPILTFSRESKKKGA
jgi:ATP-dependent protease Clp ATPase subunit